MRGVRGERVPGAADRRRTAVDRLFELLMPMLLRWTHRRLPPRARRRMDSADLIQEALVGVLEHLPDLDERSPERVQAYAQQAIRNRIRDEIRRADKVEVSGGDGRAGTASRDASPLDDAMESEDQLRFRAALDRLDPGDRELIVGRVDRGLDYETLASRTGRPSAEAARVAVRRAVLRLAREMGRED
jgi:RNA polymerase sigma factor (sigma-70 family)